MYLSEKAMATHSVLLPGKSHGRRSLVGFSPWGREELDTTEWLHFHFSLSCIGEGNATHSNVLAWRIPGTAEPGELPSMGSHRVGHDWRDLAAAAAAYIFNKLPPMVTSFINIIKSRKLKLVQYTELMEISTVFCSLSCVYICIFVWSYTVLSHV